MEDEGEWEDRGKSSCLSEMLHKSPLRKESSRDGGGGGEIAMEYGIPHLLAS